MPLMYDNRIFNVNGADDELLLLALRAAFHQSAFAGAVGWSQYQSAGMILHWNTSNAVHAFPARLSAADCLPMVKMWLASDFAKTVVQLGKDADLCDYDVSNDAGFRVYLPTWEDNGVTASGVICAIKPVNLWLGK